MELLEAFYIIASSRGQGMGGPSGIQISEIREYMDIHQITDTEERVDFLRIMKMLDDHSMKMKPRTSDG